jgi:hypothetical protein
MSDAPPVIWHDVRTLVARARGMIELFSRCVHTVNRSDARFHWVVAGCGAAQAGEVRLRRADLARDLGVRTKVMRVAPGGALVEDEVSFFEGLTAGWRSPSSTSEGGERARIARERPEVHAPSVAYAPAVEYAPVWHEAHPGRPDVLILRVCHHPVVKVTARFIYVQQTCPPWVRTSPPYGPVRISREELARGEGVAAWVADKDARGSAYGTRGWFFEGAIPAQPHRPPAWHRFREEMQRMWQRHAREAAARAAPGYVDPFERWRRRFMDDVAAAAATPSFARDLNALGLPAMPADFDALKRAWRAAARRTHPDAPGGDAESFKSARAAYERLAAFLQPPSERIDL